MNGSSVPPSNLNSMKVWSRGWKLPKESSLWKIIQNILNKFDDKLSNVSQEAALESYKVRTLYFSNSTILY